MMLIKITITMQGNVTSFYKDGNIEEVESAIGNWLAKGGDDNGVLTIAGFDSDVYKIFYKIPRASLKHTHIQISEYSGLHKAQQEK